MDVVKESGHASILDQKGRFELACYVKRFSVYEGNGVPQVDHLKVIVQSPDLRDALRVHVGV